VKLYRRSRQLARLTAASPHFWVLLAMFAVGIIFQYPQQILRFDSPSLLSSLGLTRHALERILFLIPVTYAGMFFGPRAGLVTLGAAMAVILPRVFLISEYRVEAFLECGAILILGVLVNLWFEAKRRESRRYQQLLERLEVSEQGMSISEQKYLYLFENASDAIWVQDVNGLFVDGNRAFEKMTGFKRGELVGVQLAKFLSPESLNLAREVRYKLIRGEDFEQPYEQQFSIKDGSVMTVMMSTNAITAGGRISGFEHVARDVTAERQQQENVRAYIQQITRAQEEERKRVARDLHDDVSPYLLILIQQLDNLASGQRLKQADLKDYIQKLRDQAVQSLEATRRCAQGLRPRIIDDLGLVAALEWIAEDLEKSRNIAVEVATTGLDRELPAETQIVLFRIAQEALNNVRKHAGAGRVKIKVSGGGGRIVMTVADNGRGFKVPGRAEDMVSGGKLGLMGMYERARLVGGSLDIKSKPGQGTELTVRLPWGDK